MANPPKRLITRAQWRHRTRIAWIVALVADAVQLAAMPFFFAGAASPVDDVLDLIVSVALFRLLGWHPVLLPALLAELIPGVDLAPSWTLSVFVATRGHRDFADDLPPAGRNPALSPDMEVNAAPDRVPTPPEPGEES